MFPTPKSVHKDKALSNISVGFQNQMFIAAEVLPVVTVAKQSDYFFKFLKGAWFRDEAKPRGPGGRAARSGFQVSDDTYSCIEYALAHPVPLETINNADAPIKPITNGVNFVTNGVLLKMEVLVAAATFAASVWTSEEDVAGLWAPTDTTNTFITDVVAAKETIRKRTGVYPNRLVIDSDTFAKLKESAPLLDRIKYSGTQGKPADITAAMIAALFELDRVLIAGAIQSTDEETIAGTEFTAANLWEVNAGKGSALLYYHTGAPAVDSPNSGYIFNWKKSNDLPPGLVRQNGYREIRRWWEAPEKQWVLECAASVDAKVTGADAGHLFVDTIVT